MERRQGFTLVELMVVLLIIGILSTVALRTIDATRDRGLFDQTTKAMNQLVHATVGNPDLTYDGKRVDFGFFGDMERLPDSLLDLLRRPSTADAASWQGPYLHPTSVAPNESDYLLDGWGNPYSTNFAWPGQPGTIGSDGNGKYPMTVRLADTIDNLFLNTISGTISDADGNPPGPTNNSTICIKLYYNNPLRLGKAYDSVIPTAGGYYEFSPGSPAAFQGVPMGIHKLVATMTGETLTRWVTSEPRSRTVVDLKFTLSFWTKLVLVGPPQLMTGGSGFLIHIANDQAQDDTIKWLEFAVAPDSAYMHTFYIGGKPGTGFPIPDGSPGKGAGDTVYFAPVTIGSRLSQNVELDFQDFYVDSMGPPAPFANVGGKPFELLFSDGSEIKFTP